jgi:hypothetical protein
MLPLPPLKEQATIVSRVGAALKAWDAACKACKPLRDRLKALNRNRSRPA